MASTYSPILRTELIGDGQQPGAWGATTNSNFQYIFEAAIAGYVAVTVSPTSNNQVLTYTNGPSATASLDQSVYAILKLNAGTLGANFNIFAPPVSKTYIIWNNTSYSATFYNSTIIGNTTAAGSGITIPAGAKVWIWSDGTSFYGNDTVAGNLSISGNLTVAGTSTFTGSASLTTGSISGVVTAPTASAGTNTTQLATTAFVTTAVANAFPSGTRLVFAQAAAPTGWTQDTSDSANNRMMRVVNDGTGNSVGGSNSPILMNVVPSHTHTVSSSGTTSAENTGHTHGFSGNTGGTSNDHAHAGTTNGMDSGNPHNHLQKDTAGGPGVGNISTNGGTLITSGQSGYVSTDNADINHGHTFTTGGQNVGHTHGFSGSTGDISNNHNHTVTVSGTTAANGSASNWEPRYNNVIICQKN
jgi:hypothetical protein